ncbi:MAG: hypothetical protein QM528_02950 [Phycisphaerales bacterium]|nr:hypothetical protein [Phycisphaerales bacterium]
MKKQYQYLGSIIKRNDLSNESLKNLRVMGGTTCGSAKQACGDFCQMPNGDFKCCTYVTVGYCYVLAGPHVGCSSSQATAWPCYCYDSSDGHKCT